MVDVEEVTFVLFCVDCDAVEVMIGMEEGNMGTGGVGEVVVADISISLIFCSELFKLVPLSEPVFMLIFTSSSPEPDCGCVEPDCDCVEPDCGCVEPDCGCVESYCVVWYVFMGAGCCIEDRASMTFFESGLGGSLFLQLLPS